VICAGLPPSWNRIALIEMSLSSWLVAGIVPGLDRSPLKKLGRREDALLLYRWREELVKFVHAITRVAVAF
jgi:transposase